MKLEYGKRYVRRDGKITGPLKHNFSSVCFDFFDNVYGGSYTRSGSSAYGGEAAYLEFEYVEPVSDSRHTLDMCDALNTRIDQYDSTPAKKKTILLAEMLEYCLSICETGLPATKLAAHKTALQIHATLAEHVRVMGVALQLNP